MASNVWWQRLSAFSRPASGHYLPILRLGVPIAIGQVGVIVMGFADTMMVGRYNTEALAAASFVNSVYNLVTYLLLGYSYGITPLISSLTGQGRNAEAGGTFRHALFCNIAFALCVLGVLSVGYFFLDCMGQPPELLPLIRPYYAEILVSMFFVALFNALRQFADGTSDTAVGMWALLVSNALNIVGNYLLIYGGCGFPEMGLTGAGLSTLFSRVVMAGIVAVALLSRRRYAVFRQGFAACKIRVAQLRDVHRHSLPLSLQMGMESGAFAISGIMAGWLGALPLATYQVMITLSTLGFMFYYSFASGVSIRVATFYGQRDKASLLLAARAGMHITLVEVAVVSLLLYFCGGWFVSLFTSDDAVRALAVGVIPAMILYQLGDAGQICFSNILRGTSHVQPMMWIALVSYVFVNLPVGGVLAFALGLGIDGLFLAFSFGLFTAAALFYRHYRSVLKIPELNGR